MSFDRLKVKLDVVYLDKRDKFREEYIVIPAETESEAIYKLYDIAGDAAGVDWNNIHRAECIKLPAKIYTLDGRFVMDRPISIPRKLIAMDNSKIRNRTIKEYIQHTCQNIQNLVSGNNLADCFVVVEDPCEIYTGYPQIYYSNYNE